MAAVSDKEKAWADAVAIVSRDYPDVKDKSEKWYQLAMQEYKKAIGVSSEKKPVKETLLMKQSEEFSILREIYEVRHGNS